MVISATIIDLAISGATVRISNFPIQIWILLENPVQTQVRSSQLDSNLQCPTGPCALRTDCMESMRSPCGVRVESEQSVRSPCSPYGVRAVRTESVRKSISSDLGLKSGPSRPEKMYTSRIRTHSPLLM